MNSSTLDTAAFIARLEALERQNGRMKRALVCTVLAAGTLALGAASGPARDQKTIEAEQIVIRDQAGKKRIFLGIDDSKEAGGARAALYLMDKDEKHSLVALANESGGAGIDIAQGGQTRMTLTTGTERFAGLMMYASPGKHDQGEIGLFYANDGKPTLFFNDQNNKTRAMILLETGGRPMLFLQDEKGKPFFGQAQP